MSFIDTLDEIKYQFGRFIVPTLFLATAIILLRIALVPQYAVLNNGEVLAIKQSPFFLYGAIFFLLSSVVWFLYIFGMIKTMVGYGIMVLMGGISAYLLVNDYKTVKDDVEFRARFDRMDRDIRARMTDIKSAEIAYKEYYRKYTANMDSLIWFVKNGKKMSVPNIGTLPSRTITPEERDYIYGDNRPIDRLMTEQEANILAHSANPPADLIGFSRDTVYLPVLDAVFYDEKFQKRREKMAVEGENLIPFHPDSLRYVPYSGGQLVQLDTGSVLKGDLRVPTLMIRMIHPMDSGKVYQIGDVNDNHLRDNWSK